MLNTNTSFSCTSHDLGGREVKVVEVVLVPFEASLLAGRVTRGAIDGQLVQLPRQSKVARRSVHDKVHLSQAGT